MAKQTIDALIDGGNASAGPPLGPALGPTGINVNEVIAKINEKTKDMAGMKIPVKVLVDPETKEFEIKVGSPPTSALIKKELSLEKGTQDGTPVGNLEFDQLMKIVRMKKDSLLSYELKGAVKEVLGACKSVGVTVEGKSPKEISAAIDQGEFNDRLDSSKLVEGKAEEPKAEEPKLEEEAEPVEEVPKEETVEGKPVEEEKPVEEAPKEEKLAEEPKPEEKPDEPKLEEEKAPEPEEKAPEELVEEPKPEEPAEEIPEEEPVEETPKEEKAAEPVEEAPEETEPEKPTEEAPKEEEPAEESKTESE